MPASTITDLLVTGVHGVFLVRTRSEPCYILTCEADPDGHVIISGGKDKLENEKVRFYKGNVRVAASIMFIREDHRFGRTAEVTEIQDITLLDEETIARLKST